MSAYVTVVQIIVSVVLIALILLQAKGQGFSASFSSDSSIFRTRRGVEKTLFQITIAIAVLWVLMSVVSVLVARA